VRSLVHDRVTVDIPATTANLGAGFDALALALDLRNTVSVELRPELPPHRVELSVSGQGAGLLPADGRNRFMALLSRGLRDAGCAPDAGWRVHMDNDIPLSRGLGSSAAATVGGLVAADALLGGGVLAPERILELAVSAEGHPDNAAATLFGGFCVVTGAEGSLRAVRFDPPPALRVVLFIPDRPLSTADMRAALPAQVPFATAVHNVGAVALVVAAMATGQLDLLGPGTQDQLHEPYRAAVYPELPVLVRAARAAGALGACLSGAGSTVIAFSHDDGDEQAEAVAAAMAEAAAGLRLAGRTHVGRPRSEGARIVAVG
jgi:homoserine kinase